MSKPIVVFAPTIIVPATREDLVRLGMLRGLMVRIKGTSPLIVHRIDTIML